MKRRRALDSAENIVDAPAKRQKLLSNLPAACGASGAAASLCPHPVLSRVYPVAVTLRQYILSKLPSCSKNRRRRIGHVGLGDDQNKELGGFLDRVLIGVAAAPGEGETRRRTLELQNFTQELVKSTARSDIDTAGLCWDEVIQFVIWVLFKRASHKSKPVHLLCHGFSRDPPYHARMAQMAPMSSVTGLYSVASNASLQPLKAPSWANIFSMLKGGGDKIMIDLLLDCGIFEHTDANNGALLQISGIPITTIAASEVANSALGKQLVPRKPPIGSVLPPRQTQAFPVRTQKSSNAARIHFLRSRMFYGKANLNANGRVCYGLSHIHVFNRYSNVNDPKQTLQVMKYIFPHTFKLHNPFTSEVDRRETAMRLKDYTTREKEITQASLRLHPNVREKLPKRLSSIAEIVRRIRKRHTRCSYPQIFYYHCHSKLDQHGTLESGNDAAGARQKITDFATPHAEVSSFCKAVMSKLLPSECFGADKAAPMSRNFDIFCSFIDEFVRLRKSETLSLYDLCKGMALTSFTWLCPPGMDPQSKMSQTDFATRTLLLWQFCYFLVDSILMPLIRSHFHVTESNTDRLRIFYFRHEVWKKLTEPTIMRMKQSGLTALPPKQGASLPRYIPTDTTHSGNPKIFRSAKFRLVPKQNDFRLITNLGHREQVNKGGRIVLDVSTNTKLWPVHQAMRAEYTRDKTILGSAMFNKGEIGTRLQDYRHALTEQGWKPGIELYLAKVDIQSCFDSIPQDKALELLEEEILAANTYDIQKYADVSPPTMLQYNIGSACGTVRSRYASHSMRSHQHATTSLAAADRPLTPLAVRTPTAPVVTETQARLHALLRTHIAQHTIRIGKKEYRQAQGVPQGSVISTLLCNFFYAKHERQHLAFLRRPDTTMMRLIDDFLVISRDKSIVQRFVDLMHAGNPDFGLTVKASKTVVSWDRGMESFPFCGLEINTRTLEVLKQPGGKTAEQTFDTLTVEHSREPGRVFHRKMLNGLKIQLQPVLLESSLNSPSAALTNLYALLHSSAARSYAYTRSNRIADPVLIKTVADLAATSASTMRSHAGREQEQHRMSAHAYQQRQKHCLWLACRAYYEVFQRRQTGHAALLRWLVSTMEEACAGGASQRASLEAAVRRFERAVAVAVAAAG